MEEWKKIRKKYFVFTGNKSDERIKVEVGLMHDSLERIVKKKQKERYIGQAIDEQKDYEVNIDEKEICAKIKNTTIKKIKEKFSSILIEEDNRNGIIKIALLNMENYT